jgi:hypothetical protein
LTVLRYLLLKNVVENLEVFFWLWIGDELGLVWERN